jgi:dTDP-4-dehydrorhamnose 3,5-epimerase
MIAHVSCLTFRKTPLGGLMLIERSGRSDPRGMFTRLFCEGEFVHEGVPLSISQINVSLTHRRGCVRGLHFQHPPHAETKLVTCVRGEVFDVAVDLRHNSPTFLHWHAEILSGENRRSLLIPDGFAHGFQTLSDGCELLYLHSAPYVPDAEGGLSPSDPAVAIQWPLSIAELSPRDSTHPPLDAAFRGLELATQ